MSLFPQGTLAKYYVILHAWLCDTTTQLHYDIQNEGYLHMLGKYSVKPRMFVCCDFAENVYVMKKSSQSSLKSCHMSRVPCKRMICRVVESSE